MAPAQQEVHRGTSQTSRAPPLNAAERSPEGSMSGVENRDGRRTEAPTLMRKITITGAVMSICQR